MKALAAVVAGIFPVVALLSFCAAPTAPSGMTEADRAQIKVEVMQLADAWMDVWRVNDCELSRPLMHPDRMSVMWGGRPHKSVEEWMDHCTTTIANRAQFNGSWTDTIVRVLSSDAAVFVGTYSSSYEYRDGIPARHYPSASQVMRVERTATGWGVTRFENSNGPSEVVGEG